jgi:hypothetical protein
VGLPRTGSPLVVVEGGRETAALVVAAVVAVPLQPFWQPLATRQWPSYKMLAGERGGTGFCAPYSRTAVAVRAAASAISTVGIAASTAKVLTATTIIASGNYGVLGSYRRSGRCSGRVAAAGQASSSAMALGRSTPSVLRAASALVDCAVGVAEQVAVVRSALPVLGVLALPLLWDNAKV